MIAVAVVGLAGCGDGRSSGMLITGDGRMLANNAANTRDEAVRAITTQLSAQIGTAWRVSAVIAEQPDFIDDPHSTSAGDFRWRRASVTVTCAGDGEPAATPADIERAVRDFMKPKMARGGELSVAVQLVPAGPAPAAVIPGQQAARSYTVQAGDTLADISAAFYGTTQHWRRIREANPSVDPANLASGTVLQIP